MDSQPNAVLGDIGRAFLGIIASLRRGLYPNLIAQKHEKATS
jgi:hypothetical protein